MGEEPAEGPEAGGADEPEGWSWADTDEGRGAEAKSKRSSEDSGSAPAEAAETGGTAEMKSDEGTSSVFILPVSNAWWATEGRKGPQRSGVYSVGTGVGVVAYASLLIISIAAGPG